MSKCNKTLSKGKWWLPATPKRTAQGEGEVLVDGAVPKLDLFSPLEGKSTKVRRVYFPEMWGKTDSGEMVTIFNLDGLTLEEWWEICPDIPYVTMSGEMSANAHLKCSDITTIDVQIDYLDEWAARSKPCLPSAGVVAEAEVRGVTFKLIESTQPGSPRSAYFQIGFKAPKTSDIRRAVSLVCNLMATVTATLPNISVEAATDSASGIRLSLPLPHTERPSGATMLNPQDILVDWSKFIDRNVLGKWLQFDKSNNKASQRFQAALGCGRGTYVETRLLLLFQTLESMTPSEPWYSGDYPALMEQIHSAIANLDTATQEDAARVIKIISGRNTGNLNDRLLALFSQPPLDSLHEEIGKIRPKFTQDLVKLRNYASHPTKNHKLSHLEQFATTELAYVFARALILTECGIAEAPEKILHTSQIQWVRDDFGPKP